MTIRIIRNVARYIMGTVFIFSGFVKAIDPWGSAYKFSDYFEAFGMPYLIPVSLALAIILSTTEFLIGLNLFLKIRMKETAWALTVFMVFFTGLTLFIAITNPVTDCGCFGDALVLTNWQTFKKNLFFLLPTVVVFQQRNNFITGFAQVFEWVLTGLLAVLVVFLSVYCIRNLPLIDFRPYKIGANIPRLLEIPEGMPADEFETILIYEKNGITKEFTLDSPEKPWSDTSWKWVETKNILIRKGYVPPIHDFSIISPDRYDLTDAIIGDPDYSFLVISHNISKANRKGLERINAFAGQAADHGYYVYGMTSSTPQAIQKAAGDIDLSFTFNTTDEITLKTIIRSNPGLLLLKEGIVIGKWHFRNIPDVPDLEKYGGISYALTTSRKERSDAIAIIVVLLIGLIGSVLYFFRSDK